MLNKIVLKNRGNISLYGITYISSSILSVIITYFFQNILDDFSSKSTKISQIVLFSVFSILTVIINYILNYPNTKLSNKLYYDFKMCSFEKMETISYLNYEKRNTGELLQVIENGSNAGRSIVMDFYLRLICELIPKMLVSLYFIFFIDKKIIYLVITGYIFVFLITRVLFKYLYRIKEKILTNEEKFNRRFMRGFIEFITFRFNNRFRTEFVEINKEAKEITNKKIDLKMIHELFFTIFGLIVVIIKIIMLIYGIKIIDISVGKLVALLTYLDNVYTPIAIFNVIYVQYKLDKIALMRYNNFISAKNDERLCAGSCVDLEKTDINFQNVSFEYNKNKKILYNINLKIKNNTINAIVGESGSGKTTLIKLLLGLYPVSDGSIKINNTDINSINLSNLYKQVAYITQNAPIFDGTLKENIVFNKNVENKYIYKVLNIVGLNDLIKRLDNNLDAYVGEGGNLLSGGEKQKLSLARIFFSNANLIILDEATASMDYKSEKDIVNVILEKFTHKTVILIAHRIESIKNVDNIIFLKNGMISGCGTFSNLYNTNIAFKTLYNSKAY